MNNTATTQTTPNPREGLMAVFAAALEGLTEEQLARLAEQQEAFAAAARELVLKFAQPKPVESPAHETIRIPCVIGGRNYVACGFLRAGEPSVIGKTMLERTATVPNTRAIGDEDWEHLSENHKDFYKYPELARYYLATDRRDPAYPRGLCCFLRYSREWYDDSYSVENHWDVSALVWRRCT